MYNKGLLLYEIADAADGTGQSRTKAEQAWGTALDALSRFTNACPQSPLAGDAYVKQVGIALERLFDLKLANTICQSAAHWVKRAETEGHMQLVVENRNAWHQDATLKASATEAVLAEYYIRGSVVAYLKGDFSRARDLISRFNLDERSPANNVPTARAMGMKLLLGTIESGTTPWDERALTAVSEPSMQLAVRLIDVMVLSEQPQDAIEICDRLLSKHHNQRSSIKPIESYLIIQKSLAMLRINRSKALACLQQLYAEKYRDAAWTAQGLLYLGILTFNTTQDAAKAMPHYEYIIRKYPDDPTAMKAMYFCCLNSHRLAGDGKTREYCRMFLEKYPDSQWADEIRRLLITLDQEKP
jgi:tetratricopeptide (TPR) repeat protein